MIIEYVIYIAIAVMGISGFGLIILLCLDLENLKNERLEEEKEEKEEEEKEFYKNKYSEIFGIFRITNINIYALDNKSDKINSEIVQLRENFIYAPNEKVEQKIENEIKKRKDYLKKISERQITYYNTFVERLEATDDEDFIYWFKNFYAKEWF